MNTPVSFELAKLLKGKGFDENCSDYYTQTGNLNSDGWGDIIYEQGFGFPDRMLRFNYSDFNKNQKETCFLCPTIGEVCMWLYEKHEYWCYVYTNGKIWHPCIQHKFGDMAVLSGKIGESNSPTEAYEAAIKYTLKNLL